MARRVDLIDQFTELVVGADDPRRLAERTLEVVMSLLNGRSGAVFTCEGPPTLFASRGIDQAVLDVVPVVWSAQQDALRRGETFYVADCASERRITLTAERPVPASFAMVPVLQEEHLLALLYVALRAGNPMWRRRAIAAEGVAIYWHFLDGLWVFLLLLLNSGR